MRHQLIKYLSLLSLLVGLSTGSQATIYTFTSVDVSGALDTFTNGINDNGEIVGNYDDATGIHGFVRPPGGNIQTFHSGSDISGNGINNSGDIVGSVTTDTEHPYLSNT